MFLFIEAYLYSTEGRKYIDIVGWEDERRMGTGDTFKSWNKRVVRYTCWMVGHVFKSITAPSLSHIKLSSTKHVGSISASRLPVFVIEFA